MSDIIVKGDDGTSAIVGTATPANIIVNGSLIGPQGPAGESGASIDSILASAAQDPESMFVGPVTVDVYGAPLSAAVTWPDGTSGTYTAITVSTDFPGNVDAYSITYGSSTYTQPAVTRDGFSTITNKPRMVIT